MKKIAPTCVIVQGVIYPLFGIRALVTNTPRGSWPVKDAETPYVAPYGAAPQIVEATEWVTASSTAALSFLVQGFPTERA